MKISVITVSYNAEKSISRSIKSILNQLHYPYEYIIVDGASTDKTIDIVKAYVPQIEDKGIKFKLISEPDNGIYDAMNKGVRLATGEYIAFLNTDDWYEIDTIKTVEDEYSKGEFDFAYGSICYNNDSGKILIKKSKKDKFISSRNWNHPSSFAKRSLYIEYPFKNDIYKTYADFDWYLHVRKLPIKIHILPPDKIISNFTIGGASINKSLRASLVRANEKYRAYKANGYSKVYAVESYGWELIKYIFANLFS